MLEYNRVNVCEGIDVNKTNVSLGCIICHYWHLLGINFRFLPKVRNGCHDLIPEASN